MGIASRLPMQRNKLFQLREVPTSMRRACTRHMIQEDDKDDKKAPYCPPGMDSFCWYVSESKRRDDSQQLYTLLPEVRMGINFLHQAQRVTCVSSDGGASPRMLLQGEALYDIILCRYAVLLYADTIEQAASAIKKIVVGRLRPGGFLVLGETDNCGPDMLKSLGLEHYAFKMPWHFGQSWGSLSSPGAIFEDGEAKRKNSHGHDALAAYNSPSTTVVSDISYLKTPAQRPRDQCAPQ